MRVLMINVVCGIRSTGRICTDLASALEKQGHVVKIAYGREVVPEQYMRYAVKIGSNLDVKLHGLRARLSDGCGFGSKKATEKFIEWVKEYDPDIIHLHNIHGYYINIDILFGYLRSCNKKIIWTLHDCWAFTGHSAFCEAANCERWITGCYECPKKRDYPSSYKDNSRENWKKKKSLFDNIPNMIIITPSEWLAGLVKKSFLAQYPVQVIHNGIDINVFKPTPSKIKKRLGLNDESVVLGVAALWEKRKGLNDFIMLSEILDKKYKIVMVGLSKKQIGKIPNTIVGIERTNSVTELAELYTVAEVFVNPTYEDNYPTTNLEAIACGTPVITYKTGGSEESAKMYGIGVEKGDVKEIEKWINGPFNRKPFDMDLNCTVNKYLSIMNML